MIQFIKRMVKKILKRDLASKISSLRKMGVSVGTNFNMLEDCNIDVSHGWHIKIGDYVTLAPRVHILAHDASTKIYLDYTMVSNVIIGNKVFIGAASIIMPGTTIGNNVIIGAGSIVKGIIPDNSVYFGNPAKYYCNTSDYIDKQRLKMTNTNCFSEDYTLGGGISNEYQIQMWQATKEEGVCFVK